MRTDNKEILIGYIGTLSDKECNSAHCSLCSEYPGECLECIDGYILINNHCYLQDDLC